MQIVHMMCGGTVVYWFVFMTHNQRIAGSSRTARHFIHNLLSHPTDALNFYRQEHLFIPCSVRHLPCAPLWVARQIVRVIIHLFVAVRITINIIIVLSTI